MEESISLFDFVGLTDIIILPLYFAIIFIVLFFYVKKNIQKEPIFRFYFAGLIIKLIAGFSFIIIYYFYYPGGDTFYYFTGGSVLSNFSIENPTAWFNVMLGDNSYDKWVLFDGSLKHPMHYVMFRAKDYFFMIRLLFPLMILSFNKLLVASLLMNVILYNINFKFIRLLSSMYPKIDKYLAFTILFTPSIIFWASGIIKDSICFTATLYIVVNFYNIYINKKHIIQNVIILLINFVIIINLKPYIILALFPALSLWLVVNKTNNIQNKIIKFVFAPFIFLITIVLTYFAFSNISDNLGNYSSFESVLKKAQITQQDLIRSESYGDNNYNIGSFEPTVIGVAKKVPIAIFSGIFRPFIWEARNPLMLLSGLENLIFTLFFLYFLIKFKFILFFKYIFKDYFVSFCLFFGIFFIFSVGLTNANFGALVRLRLPGIPFIFISLIILINEKSNNNKFKESLP